MFCQDSIDRTGHKDTDLSHKYVFCHSICSTQKKDTSIRQWSLSHARHTLRTVFRSNPDSVTFINFPNLSVKFMRGGNGSEKKGKGADYPQTLPQASGRLPWHHLSLFSSDNPFRPVCVELLTLAINFQQLESILLLQ